MDKHADNIEPLHGVRLTVAALAREFEVSRDTVTRRFNSAFVMPFGKNERGYPVYRLKDAAIAILGVMTEKQNWDSIDPSCLPPAERAQLAKARLDETRKKLEDLKVDSAEGTLVSVEDCRQQMAFMKNGIVQMIDTLPDILERDCDLSSEVVSKIEIICDAERNKLAEYLMQ
jgi:phage terminase Nu1 subunit (DNA packaging protein)